jgi:predicted lipase
VSTLFDDGFPSLFLSSQYLFLLRKVEDGFNKLYGYLQEAGVAAALSDAAVMFSTGQVDVTGHSLGASLATLLAVDIARGVVASAGPQLSLRTVTTFGSPRVGDTDFVAFHSREWSLMVLFAVIVVLLLERMKGL